MFKKKIFILVILLVSLLAVSGVSAADNVMGDVSIGENSTVLEPLNAIDNDNLAKSFNQLEDEIDADSTIINLDSDYVWDEDYGDWYIYIEENKIINGNGHTINANGASKIFNVYGDNVIIKNLIFKNTCYSGDYGSPICVEANNCMIENCTFINNLHDYALIDISGEKGIVNNCRFKDNNIAYLIDVESEDFTISSCEIENNLIETAIYTNYANKITIINNVFNDNFGELINLGTNGILRNNIFNNNKMNNEWGCFIECSENAIIKNCTFNKFEFEDAKMILAFGYLNIDDCDFLNNNVSYCIDINYEETKSIMSNCRFENNIWDGYAMLNDNAVVKNPTFSNNSIRYSIGAGFSGAIVNHQYVLLLYLLDSNGIPLANQRFNYTVGGKTYTPFTDKYGNYELVYKTFGTNMIVITNPVTNEKLNRQVTLYKIFDRNKDVIKYYGSPTVYKVRVFKTNGNVAKGVEVRFNIGYSTFYAKTDKYGYATLKLNQKPGKYTVSVKYMDYYVINKVTIKKATPKISAKAKAFKKSDKKKQYIIKLFNNQNKAIKNAKVYIKVNKKVYYAKTNKKGFATFKFTKLSKGKYVANIIYKGNGYYNMLTKNVGIRVK